MKVGYLEYPLAKGYIHNWLVAGPVASEVKNLERFTGPDWKQQIAKFYFQSEPGVEGEPAEYAPFKAGELEERWNYVRTRDDHFVDLSAFYHLTHFLRAWAYAEVVSPGDQELSFILTTNGPADLWINAQHVHRQEHFFHQIPNRVKFTVHLAKGVNSLLVRLEEVAARECPYTMALQMVGFQSEGKEDDKPIRIPTLAPDSLRRMALEMLFEASYVSQDVFTKNEKVTLILPGGAASATYFNVRLQNPEKQIYAEAIRNDRLEGNVEMGFSYEFPEGPYQMLMMPPPREYYENNVRITRAYDLYSTRNAYSTQPYGTYEERRIEALNDAAHREGNVFAEIAKMELGYWLDVNVNVILAAIDGINSRKDCSDFYLCGLLGMHYRFGQNAEFPAALKQPLEDCILNFKYWDDEPGSDAMCYRTENHSILFHACEVLAGQLYPERVFTNINQPGRWHCEKGERLAMEWLENRAATGFKEWDSNTYFEEDTLALASLASHAANAQVWEMAAVVLDKMYFTIAANSYKGVLGSTHGRTYTPFIKTAYRECTSGITRLLWGMGIFNDHILGTVALACSAYELPPVIAAIAADLPEEVWNREQHTGSAQDFKDSGSLGTGVNKVTYKTPDYMLCSAQDWHPGEKGYQQHIWQATLGPLATVFTTHPTCSAEDGSHRPNYWHGNETLPRVAQWKDLLIAIYNLPADDWMGFTHAYFPVHAFENFDVREGWAFGRVGDGYIALTAARGIELQTRGDNAYRELRSEGTSNVWLCHMGRKAVDGSFEKFIANVLALPVKFGQSNVELTSLRGEPVSFGWKGAFKVGGKLKKLSGFKHYDSPYCKANLNADTMEIRYGLDVLKLHFGPQEEKEQE
jgi:hypothetical protein